MEDHIRTEAVAAARQLLHRFKAQHPAWTDDRTPIDELVSWYGLEVVTFHADDQPPGTYGWLEPGEDLVWLCRNLPGTLRRFTLAHELGHAALHRYAGQQQEPQLSHDDPCQGADVQEEVTGQIDHARLEEILGIGQSYNPRSQRELAANIFAAELLMPLERVQALYLTLQTPPQQLAGIFGVSTSAMLNRLTELLWGGGLCQESETSGSEDGMSPESAAIHRDERPPSPKKQYDEFQQAAIEAPTPALIVAGPGSGKTSTLIGRAEYLIHTLGMPPQHMLALIFSRKAAQEMQERLQQALHLTHVHDTSPTVSTFHAFCAELLRTHGELVGLRPDFTFVDDMEGYFLLRQLAGELPLRHYQHLRLPTYYFPDMLRAISRAKDELVTPEQYQHLAQQMLEQAQNDEEVQKAEQALEVAAIYACYQAGLQQRGDTDFGGLIMLTTQLLQQYPEVLYAQQQRYQHILVDEFQDMNRASGVLLRLLAGDAQRVWVVGDANQAIYGFRGASPANITNFKDDYPGATVLPLNCNYRSRPDIVSFADTFRRARMEQDTAPATLRTARPTQPGAYVTLATAVDEASELAGLVADIRYKQTQHGYAYRDMVVLCRTRAQVRKISHALAQAGLPVIEHAGGSIVEQEHIQDLLSILLLVAEPSGMGILRAARQSTHALSQSDIEALLLAAREQQCTPASLIIRGEAPPSMSASGRGSLTHLADMLQALHRTPTVWSMLAQYLFIETSIMRDLLCAVDSQSTEQPQGTAPTNLADYAAILQLAHHFDQRQQQADARPMQEQVRGFLDYLNVMVMLRQDGAYRQQSTADDGAESTDSIRVITVHASKGLEFPIVYLPSLVQRRFPMQARSSPISAPAGMLATERASQAAHDIHESGEACLFYVGVTRARDHLVLSYSERYGKQKYKPSPYLDALLAGLPPERITRLRWETVLAKGGDPDQESPPHPPDTYKGYHYMSFPPLRGTNEPSASFIDAMKPTTLNISAIETYQTCPRRYLYGSIYRFQREESAYQLFWQATQKTLEALQMRLSEIDAGGTRLPTQTEAQELYSHHWRAVGGHEMPFATIYEQHGREIVASLCSMLAAGKDVAWQLRRSFEVEVAGTVVRVEVDRVEASAQAGKPVRFVRTRVGKSKEKPTAQVRELLYAHAYRRQYPGQSIEVQHHNISTGEMLSMKLTEKREQKLYDELEQTLRGLEQGMYPATPDAFVCPTCPFFLICPA